MDVLLLRVRPEWMPRPSAADRSLFMPTAAVGRRALIPESRGDVPGPGPRAGQPAAGRACLSAPGRDGPPPHTSHLGTGSEGKRRHVDRRRAALLLTLHLLSAVRCAPPPPARQGF